MTLRTVSLRKAMRLAARAEAYADVARQTNEVAEQARLQLNELLAEAFDEAGILAGANEQYSINFKTGTVTLHEGGSP